MILTQDQIDELQKMKLSQKQKEVFDMICEGLNYKEMCNRTGCTYYAIANIVHIMKRKINTVKLLTKCELDSLKHASDLTDKQELIIKYHKNKYSAKRMCELLDNTMSELQLMINALSNKAAQLTKDMHKTKFETHTCTITSWIDRLCGLSGYRNMRIVEVKK